MRFPAASATRAIAAGQPLDSDLTAIAALATTAFGRSLLAQANAAAALATLGAQATSEKAAASGYASLDSGTKVPVAQLPTMNSMGTLASRPAANAVPAGYLYFASDDNGGTPYRSDGSSTWTKAAASVLQSGGAELSGGYAEITSAFQVLPAVANTVYDVTGLSVTVTVGARPVFIQAYFPQAWHQTANSDVNLLIYEDGSPVQNAPENSVSTTLKAPPLVSLVRRAPAAGSHTYKASVKSTVAGNLTFNAGAAFPAFIRVVEC